MFAHVFFKAHSTQQTSFFPRKLNARPSNSSLNKQEIEKSLCTYTHHQPHQHFTMCMWEICMSTVAAIVAHPMNIQRTREMKLQQQMVFTTPHPRRTWCKSYLKCSRFNLEKHTWTATTTAGGAVAADESESLTILCLCLCMYSNLITSK